MEVASEVIRYHRPRENDNKDDNQEFVFHSPVEKVLVYMNPEDFVVFKQQFVTFNKFPDYNDKIKRQYLNECIHMVYVMHRWGHKITFDEAATVKCGRDELKEQLDDCFVPPCSSPWDYQVFKVKRQLFRTFTEGRVRKQEKVRRNPYFGITLGMNAKPVRHLIERVHIRRIFWNDAPKIAKDLMMRETLIELKKRAMYGIPFFADPPKLPPWIPIPLRGTNFT